MAAFMTAEERAEAKNVGVSGFLNCRRFKKIKVEYIFGALDAAVASMKALDCPEPFNGRVLGAMAVMLIKNDTRAMGEMYRRKIKAVVEGDSAERTRFFELMAYEVGERYLASRKGQVPTESRLTSPEFLLERFEEVFEEMEHLGKALSEVAVAGDEIALTPGEDMPDTTDIARAMVEGSIGAYESLVPETEDGELPNAVERRAVAKAAFLRLGLDDLKRMAEEKDLGDLPDKKSLAKALSEAYQDELDEVAKLTLKESSGDPRFGLITRLLLLSSPPDMAKAENGLKSLTGRYYEVRPAVFFVYREISLSSDGRFLTVKGAIRSFRVNPAEVGGEVILNRRPRREEITIKLEKEQPWAMVTGARASDLWSVAAVLRRSGEVSTAPSVAAPDPIDEAEFGSWDPRSLWMLDLIRRDLCGPSIRLAETLMANFDQPKGTSSEADEEEDDDLPVAPKVDSVRLKGRQLQDHPEVCGRIVGRSHLKELEMKVEKADQPNGAFSKRALVRIAWEKSHLAVMTGAQDDEIDGDLHQKLVRTVREAALRPLSVDLIPTLAKIKKRSEETDVGNDAEPVFRDPDDVEPVDADSKAPAPDMPTPGIDSTLPELADEIVVESTKTSP
jgi:hypothetical protein